MLVAKAPLPDKVTTYYLDEAIKSLKHAQVYDCSDEDKIVEAENDLILIRSQVKK